MHEAEVDVPADMSFLPARPRPSTDLVGFDDDTKRQAEAVSAFSKDAIIRSVGAILGERKAR